MISFTVLLSLTYSQHLTVCWYYFFIISTIQMDAISHCFSFYFPNVQHLACFHVLIFHLVGSVEMPTQVICSFYKCIVWFPLMFCEFFIQSGYWPSVRYEAGKALSPFYRLPFCPFDGVFCLTESFQFHEVPFINC